LKFEPETIFVEKGAENFSITREILQRFSNRPKVLNANLELVLNDLRRKNVDLFGAAKRQLFLSRFKGSFLKKCPGVSPGMVCCNYFVINLMSNCIYDCSYCILQDFLENNPILQAYVNVEDALLELDEILQANPQNFYRIGTGEIADSLALDNILTYSEILIPFFNSKDNALLELKTKSSCVENLLKQNPKNVVVSWSINPPEIVDREEKFTAPFKDRIESARQCQKKGFRIGLHFDPVILFPGWENAYLKTVEEIFQTLGSSPIEWISIGGFRYRPNLKRVVKERHPKTILFHGEQTSGEDGKFRYLRTLRSRAFETLKGFIRNHSRNVGVYLCMEPKEVWRDSTGSLPRDDVKLAPIFSIRDSHREQRKT
tara:strand:+ start:1429 stop:2547 length:1119 start_codon:yes stop_codon:yes gene_type:complete